MIFPIRVVPLLFLCAFALFSGAVVHESRHFMYNVDLMLLHVEIFRVSLRHIGQLWFAIHDQMARTHKTI